MRIGNIPASRIEWWVNHRTIVAKTTCGLVLMAVLFYYVDPAILRRIYSVEPICFFLAVSTICLQLLIFSARFHLMTHCAGGGMPLSQAALANFELAFIVQLVPTQLAGDAVRVVRARKCGMTWTHGFCAVFLDRAIGLMTMAITAPLILLFVPLASVNRAVLAMTMTLIVGGLVCFAILHILGPRLQHLSGSKVIRAVIAASDMLRTLVKNPWLALFALVVSVVGHLCSAVAISLVGQGLGINLPILPMIPAMALIQIALMVPLSIGGWGVREGAAVFVMGLIGVATTDSLSISIVYGLASLAVGLVGGIVWIYAGYSASEIEDELNQAPVKVGG